jgi:hypothetical protein
MGLGKVKSLTGISYKEAKYKAARGVLDGKPTSSIYTFEDATLLVSSLHTWPLFREPHNQTKPIRKSLKTINHRKTTNRIQKTIPENSSLRKPPHAS